MGYGVMMIRRKGERIEMPDGFRTRLQVDGVLKTAFGNIVGYRCCDCGQVASITKWKDHFHMELPQYDMLGCDACNGYDVEPIYDDYIVGKE